MSAFVLVVLWGCRHLFCSEAYAFVRTKYKLLWYLFRQNITNAIIFSFSAVLRRSDLQLCAM